MRKPRLATLTFALLFAAALASIGAVAAASVAAMRRLNVDASLHVLAEAAAAIAADPGLSGPSAAEAAARIAAAARGTSLRVTLVSKGGAVLADSAAEASAMANHADRPELASALAGKPAAAARDSSTLGVKMAYAAAPVIDPATGAVLGAAGDWSAGRLDRRIRRFGRPDFEPLADTMNAMAAELSERIAAAGRHRRELEAILDGMGEAVLSTDPGLVVRLANPKALELLSKPSQAVVGHTVLQATGSVAIDELARRCASEGGRLEAELPMYGDQVKQLSVKAAPLASDDGGRGAVLVLSDITRLKRLERVRQDFVANVSHELRTPVTLIKGFAETLGQVDDPAESAHFLSIIERHADRMASIIDDLLSLARLESPERERLETKAVDAASVLGKAVESLGDKPQHKGIGVAIDCPPGLAAEANEGLLEQALVNLLDNAVKYSKPGCSVRASARIDGGYVRFEIRDDGPGIPARDIPRLFERFYTVDKTRSRELGGTGLGLAIVRHIASAHGGDASVESREGAGSAFSIRVPARRPRAAG